MQVLADVRRQLHCADEDEEYAEEHRERLEHYRAHLGQPAEFADSRAKTPPIDRRRKRTRRGWPRLSAALALVVERRRIGGARARALRAHARASSVASRWRQARVSRRPRRRRRRRRPWRGSSRRPLKRGRAHGRPSLLSSHPPASPEVTSTAHARVRRRRRAGYFLIDNGFAAAA